MYRSGAERRAELEAFRRASDPDTVVVPNDTAHEKCETRQLLVLCIGTTGLIVADALIWVYFWMI
jgi:hypothetical protein